MSRPKTYVFFFDQKVQKIAAALLSRPKTYVFFFDKKIQKKIAVALLSRPKTYASESYSPKKSSAPQYGTASPLREFVLGEPLCC